MKKNADVHIKLSKELKEKLKQRARESGISLNQYCLFILSNVKIKSIEIEKS